MPPVIDGPWRFVVAAFYDPRMFAEDIAIRCSYQPLGEIRRLTGRFANDAGAL